MATDRYRSKGTASSYKARKVVRARSFALDRASGKAVWNVALGRGLDQDRGGGPRGTPTTDGDSIYSLSENGDLACIRSKDASIAWKRNILSDFGGRNPYWLISESPLIDGSKVVVTPGGRGAGIVSAGQDFGKGSLARITTQRSRSLRVLRHSQRSQCANDHEFDFRGGCRSASDGWQVDVEVRKGLRTAPPTAPHPFITKARSSTRLLTGAGMRLTRVNTGRR